MRANELRLGNIVKSGNQLITLSNIIEVDMANHLEPIPLTEEWLTRLGFDEENKKYIGIDSAGSNYLLVWEKIGEAHFFDYETNQSACVSVNIKHVHTLQNLFFALTNTELTITE